jgi:hypothetical protein
VVVRKVAYQSHRGLREKVLGRQGNRPEEESLFRMDQGRRGRREGSRRAGTVLAVGSSVALDAGAGLVVRPDATDLAVPVRTHS